MYTFEGTHHIFGSFILLLENEKIYKWNQTTLFEKD